MKRVVAAEQFFTTTAVVEACLELLERYFGLDEFALVVEPSAGAGAFFENLPADRRIGLDILPLHDGVTRQDFLTWQPPTVAGKVLTIGNPPFGRRAKLAVQFLIHAASYSDVIAFILPRSFNKYTFQNRIPAEFHLVASMDCEHFVSPLGAPVQVKSVFQVWEKRDTPRAKLAAQGTHPDFELRHAHLSRVSAEELAQLRREYEFAIPQVGKDFTPRDAATITKGSYWFIKPNSPQVRSIFEQLDFSFLDEMNTNLKSLAKTDIVIAYECQ